MSSRGVGRSGARGMALVVGCALTVLGSAFVTPAGASAVETRRIAGENRFHTAALASDAFADASAQPVESVILASGLAFPDAVSAGGFAGHQAAPILLTRPDRIPPETIDALDALDPPAVYLMGGPAAVGPSVEQDLKDRGHLVIRLWGANRFETAAQVARAVGAGNVGDYQGLRTAIVATGENFPDALAVGPIAFAGVHPVLLARQASLPSATRAALEDLGIEQVIIAGGEAAVGSGVASELEEITGRPPVRLFGSDRFATAAAVADEAVAGFGFPADHVLLAFGRNFPDALAAGPLGGALPAPILLTGSLPTSTHDWLREHRRTIEVITAMGGTAVISDATLEAARLAATALLILSPAEATRNAGEMHTLTAEVSEEDGEPVEDGSEIRFEIYDAADGSRVATADETTSEGEATHSYTSGEAREDIVVACLLDNASVDAGVGPSQNDEATCLEGDAGALELDEDGNPANIDQEKIHDTARVTWVVPVAPANLALSPQSADNLTGDDHTVTATVTDEGDDPASGVQVLFVVTRDGDPAGEPSTGTGVTNLQGEATFTYSNDEEGTDTITACTEEDGSLPEECPTTEDLTDTAGKNWIPPGIPANLTLAPDEAENFIGDDHTVTATVTDEEGGPAPGVDVLFMVTRNGELVGEPAAGTGRTDLDGEATFIYANDEEGTDTITACTEEDGSLPGICPTTEDLTDDVEKTWIEPAIPASLALAPETDENEVGENHTVTATVLDEGEDPVTDGTAVRFEAWRDGEVIDSGEDTTTGGEATFTYSNTVSGEDTIVGCTDPERPGTAPEACATPDPESGEPIPDEELVTGEAAKTWTPGAAESLALSPEDATSVIGTQHTVMASLEDGFGNPVADGTEVLFEVWDDAAIPLLNVLVTDGSGATAGGVASFSFSHDEEETLDIWACTDPGDPGTAPGDCRTVTGDPDPDLVTDVTTVEWVDADLVLSVATQPADHAANDPIPGESPGEWPQALVEDEDGAPVAGATVTVSIDPGGFTGGSTTEAVTGADGIATFDGLEIFEPARQSYTLTFDASGADPAAADPFAIINPVITAATSSGEGGEWRQVGDVLTLTFTDAVDAEFENLSATDVEELLGLEPGTIGFGGGTTVTLAADGSSATLTIGGEDLATGLDAGTELPGGGPDPGDTTSLIISSETDAFLLHNHEPAQLEEEDEGNGG